MWLSTCGQQYKRDPLGRQTLKTEKEQLSPTKRSFCAIKRVIKTPTEKQEESCLGQRGEVMVDGATMLCPAWLVALVLLCAGSFEVNGQCWEQERCGGLSSEENILECIHLCQSDLTDESPVYPGNGHLKPPPEAEHMDTEGEGEAEETAVPQLEEKRSYSMEHFRWGKPVGRKRRPVKIFPNIVEESTEAYPLKARRELSGELDYPLEEEEEEEEQDVAQDHPQLSPQEKKDGTYKMKHFRWSGPYASKRYGGFMKSWDEHSQKPLMTLFKNAIIKDDQQKRAQ
ncbi:hypothetical protein AAFF_G00361460 [Aldrovandia affinis]|uniref:Met-enkephalin n=1 Tax=Aldrovandia affinis TaxID=143900 RepID=A0AAD7SIN2_9TELE|nr:hypothetical protein AAFF_G00361460 [Aldrovandia affinis]